MDVTSTPLRNRGRSCACPVEHTDKASIMAGTECRMKPVAFKGRRDGRAPRSSWHVLDSDRPFESSKNSRNPALWCRGRRGLVQGASRVYIKERICRSRFQEREYDNDDEEEVVGRVDPCGWPRGIHRLLLCPVEPSSPDRPEAGQSRLTTTTLAASSPAREGPRPASGSSRKPGRTPTRLIKSVVTDDQGRYLVPDLPAGDYDVWVRGYGLVDSPKVKATSGESREPEGGRRAGQEGRRRVLPRAVLVLIASAAPQE